MKNFRYVTVNERKETKKELIGIINIIQDDVRPYFTFRFDFVGSDPLNMVTMDEKSNIGFDFDVNIEVNDNDEHYSAKDIKKILINAFNKYLKKYGYDYCEDSTRVITIKVKDRKNAKILHSCDFAIVNTCDDGRQQYIRFNKEQNIYTWEYQPKGFYKIDDKIKKIKDISKWQEFRNLYLEKKSNNYDENKKSRSLRAEAINEVYHKYFND